MTRVAVVVAAVLLAFVVACSESYSPTAPTTTSPVASGGGTRTLAMGQPDGVPPDIEPPRGQPENPGPPAGVPGEPNFPASAASIGIRTRFCADNILANCVTTGTFGSTFSDTALLTNATGGVLDGFGSGTGSFGTLGAFASATLSDFAQGTYQSSVGGRVLSAVRARARFIDEWTVLGGSVSDGILNLTFNVTGSGLPQGGSTGFAAGFLAVNGVGTTEFGDFTHTFSLPVTIGSPLAVDVSLSAIIASFDFSNPSVYDYSGVANFSNTAILTEILITDLSGNPIRGTTLIAASRTDYPVSSLNSGQ